MGSGTISILEEQFQISKQVESQRSEFDIGTKFRVKKF